VTRTQKQWTAIILGLCIFAGAVALVQAQDDAQETWQEPVNLSFSGTGRSPVLGSSSRGLFALWPDAAAGFFGYAEQDGSGVWQPPVLVELPFGTRAFEPELRSTDATPLYVPRLVMGQADRVHAFWRDANNVLYHSTAPAALMTDFAAWSIRQPLAASAVAVDAVMDVNGGLHLVYVRPQDTPEAPAGVYYRQSVDGGATWSESALLYGSSYLRTAVEDARVGLTAVAVPNEPPVLVAVFDNPALDQVWQLRSADGGQTWAAPQLVDQRRESDSPESVGPGQSAVQLFGDELHLVWQAGHGLDVCRLQHQLSTDAGQSWREAAFVPLPFDNCPDRVRWVAGSDEPMLLIQQEGQSFLLAWYGEQWSEAQMQPPLSSFVNPLSYQLVDFRWQQAQVVDGQLQVVGDDRNATSDVWFLQRPVGDVADWFPPPSVWGAPVVAGSSELPVQSPLLVADSLGQVHLFWVQPYAVNGGALTLYHVLWNGELWSRPAPVGSSPTGDVVTPSVVALPDGRLLAAWVDNGGQLYTSLVQAARAMISAEWSPPMSVAVGQVTAAPDLQVLANGRVLLAYAAPLNEGRGIYLLASDNGSSWGEATWVFDAAAAGVPMPNWPHLATDEAGTVHLLWTNFSLPPEVAPLSGQYARSVDGGETWLPAELVAESSVMWQEVVTARNGVVHRLWQTAVENGAEFFHEYSYDGGQSWQSDGRIPGLGNGNRALAALADATGQLHLLQIDGDTVQHRVWGDGRWMLEEPLVFASMVTAHEVGLAAVLPQDVLWLAYGAALPVTELMPLPEYVLVQNRQLALELGETAVTPLPVLTPTPTLVVTPTVMPLPTATAVLPPVNHDQEGGLTIPGGETGQLVVSVLPAILLVGGVLGFGLLRMMWKRNR
jgi:hypothetical protein